MKKSKNVIFLRLRHKKIQDLDTHLPRHISTYLADPAPSPHDMSYSQFSKYLPNVKTGEIRQKKAQIRGPNCLYCRKKIPRLSFKLSTCRKLSSVKCLRTEKNLRKFCQRRIKLALRWRFSSFHGYLKSV